MLIALLVACAGAVSAHHMEKESIQKRTKPSGEVYRVGDDVPVSKPPVVETSGPRSGEEVYTAKCAMCHGAGIAGAPKVGEASAWTDRIAQGNDILFEHAIKGYQGSAGFMPAKGGCADCSDEEVIAAVEHMLEMLK
ncbi:cytochrome c5 family protein [Aliikangiella coralliicola]|uniref:Cytochrome c5 family protein n=2 Tax=Aliikangiella coralliicola TaxID=2592383 RepID=A0A545UGW2_9GAMM|nr:cytochrome c5 family protein [Aliikangiella coralliicola]